RWRDAYFSRRAGDAGAFGSADGVPRFGECPLIQRIEELLFENETFQTEIPAGLELYLSGTAVVGRDMLQAARDSAKATEHLTILLVVALLIAIYRAPLLALVPLLTVFVSVKLTMELLCWMASQGWVVLFTGIESYVTVLLYGAGVDYCLFLIARFKEEVDRGIEPQTALVDAVGSVGAAITASAGTVICGIGMMIFAEFGKFRDAGIAISFGLVIVLTAALTLTPALMRSAGIGIFWPRHRAPDGTNVPDNVSAVDVGRCVALVAETRLVAVAGELDPHAPVCGGWSLVLQRLELRAVIGPATHGAQCRGHRGGAGALCRWFDRTDDGPDRSPRPGLLPAG
ncbi:MAG: hypothetical protein B7Z55_14990, partial [Planctomycetales bacterium 12-60-4]